MRSGAARRPRERDSTACPASLYRISGAFLHGPRKKSFGVLRETRPSLAAAGWIDPERGRAGSRSGRVVSGVPAYSQKGNRTLAHRRH